MRGLRFSRVAVAAGLAAVVASLPVPAAADDGYTPPGTTFSTYLQDRNRARANETSQVSKGSLLAIAGGALILGGGVYTALATIPNVNDAGAKHDRYQSLSGKANYYAAWDDFEQARGDARLSIGLSALMLGAGIASFGIGLALVLDAPPRERSVDDFPAPWPSTRDADKSAKRATPPTTLSILPSLTGAAVRATF